jgi:signal transduction histidine kinase
MKKKILTFMAAFLLVANILLANIREIKVPESVATAFSYNFSYATEVHWEGWGNYYKATFRQNDHTMYVFYSNDAELIGIAKNVLSDNLPVLLQTGLKNKYADFWIINLSKYVIADKTGFLVTIENADEKIVLKTNDNQHWQVYSREIKA